jgi:hypothetical protein
MLFGEICNLWAENATMTKPYKLTIVLQSIAAFFLTLAFCLFEITQTRSSGFYTDADALYFPRLIEDAFHRPLQLSGWVFQAVPDLVPSLPIYLLSYLITFDFRRAIVVAAALQTCLLFGIGALLYRRYRPGGQPLVWIACFIAVLLLLINLDGLTFGLGHPPAVYGWILQMFLLNAHFGTVIGTLLCLYLTDRALRDRFGPPAAAIFACTIIFGVSDYLFLLTFTGPMLVILLWLWRVSSVKRRCLALSAAIGGGSAAAFLLGLAVNHTGNRFIQPPNLGRTKEAWRALVAVFWNGGPEPLSLVILAFDLGLAGYAALILAHALRRPQPLAVKEIPFIDIFALSAIGAASAVSIAVVGMGIFIDTATLRYCICAVFMPGMIVASLAAARIDGLLAGWNPACRETALNVAAAATICASAAVLIGGVRLDFNAPNSALLECLRQHKATAGMADYWTASPLILFSHWKYQIVQISGDGRPYYWMNNSAWMTHDWADPTQVPRFSFIVMQNLPPDRIADAYGRPDEIVNCDGTEVWFYANIQQLTARLLQRR